MPRFDPNSYDPAQEQISIPDGVYEFTVVGAAEKLSTSGNEMLSVEFAFEVGRERTLKVYDNLVFVQKAIWKVHQFCKATGLDFERGEIASYDVQGLSGKAKLYLAKPNKNGKRYMQVEAYIDPAAKAQQPTPAAQPGCAQPKPVEQQQSATASPYFSDLPKTSDVTGTDIPF